MFKFKGSKFEYKEILKKKLIELVGQHNFETRKFERDLFIEYCEDISRIRSKYKHIIKILTNFSLKFCFYFIKFKRKWRYMSQ